MWRMTLRYARSCEITEGAVDSDSTRGTRGICVMIVGTLGRRYTSQYLLVFYVILTLIAAFKIYFVTGQDILAERSDSYWYLSAADSWYWGNPANSIRPPSFPLFIVAVSKTGLPLRLSFELFFIIASVRLATAMRRLGFPPWSAALNFGLTLMAPSSILAMNLAMVESMLASVVIWMTAELAYVMTARGVTFWLHSLLLSLLAVIAWFARPETILISGAMACVITLLLSTTILRRRTAWSAVRTSTRLFGLPIFAIILANIGVAALNGVYFGRFTPIEAARAPAFVRAYDDLQGVVGQTPIHYVPVSHEQMEVAARVSPAFAEIYGAIQGKLGDPYRRNSKIYAGVDNDEIAGGWFIWLLRSAVGQTGYPNLAAEDQFYGRLSQELEAAAHSKEIAISRLPVALIDPKVGVWISYLPHSLIAILGEIVPSHVPLPNLDAVAPEVAGKFNRANGRSEASIPARELTVRMNKFVAISESVYRPIMLVIAAFGVILFTFGGWRRLTLATASVLLFALVQVIGRVGIFAVIDASSYPVSGIAAARYLLPASALLPFLFVSLSSLYFLGRSNTWSGLCPERQMDG
jgi:hypothetical protein